MSLCFRGSRTQSIKEFNRPTIIGKRTTESHTSVPTKRAKIVISGKSQQPVLFGRKLKDVCVGGQLPTPVKSLLSLLFESGPATEGVFRRCASQKQCNEARAEIERGLRTGVDDISVLVAAALLKEYLRSLPDAVCDNFKRWIDVARLSTAASQVSQLKRLVAKLPAVNRCLLSHVAAVLHKIHLSASTNKMTALNLAVCVGPNLLRAPRSIFQRRNAVHVGSIGDAQLVIQRLVEAAPEIFGSQFDACCKELASVKVSVEVNADVECQLTESSAKTESAEQQVMEADSDTEAADQKNTGKMEMAEQDTEKVEMAEQDTEKVEMAEQVTECSATETNEKCDLVLERETGVKIDTEALTGVLVENGFDGKLDDGELEIESAARVDSRSVSPSVACKVVIDVGGVAMSSIPKSEEERVPVCEESDTEGSRVEGEEPEFLSAQSELMFVTPPHRSVRELLQLTESVSACAPRPCRRFQLDVPVTWSVCRLSLRFDTPGAFRC